MLSQSKSCPLLDLHLGDPCLACQNMMGAAGWRSWAQKYSSRENKSGGGAVSEGVSASPSKPQGSSVTQPPPPRQVLVFVHSGLNMLSL
jgi:hypothetical protein